MTQFLPDGPLEIPCEWDDHEYMVRKYVRSVIDRYNERIAKQLSRYVNFDYESIMLLINEMEDNKWRNK